MVLLSSITSTLRPASRGLLLLAAVLSIPNLLPMGMSAASTTLNGEALLATGF
jgi:hypothetical protein